MHRRTIICNFLRLPCRPDAGNLEPTITDSSGKQVAEGPMPFG